MPIHFIVYPIGRLVKYQVEGVPTPAESRDFLDAVFAHRAFRKGFAFLGEPTAGHVPHAAYTSHLAREVEARSDRLGPCHWAVVVTSPAGHALVTMRAAATRRGGVEIKPFLTLEEAMEWLSESDENTPLKPNQPPSSLVSV